MNRYETCWELEQDDFINTIQELKGELEKTLQEIYLAGDTESLFKSGLPVVEEFVIKAEKLIGQAIQILIDHQEHNM
jgi:hypothetical protein